MVTEWHWMVTEMYLPFSRLNRDWKVTEWRLSVFTEWWRFRLVYSSDLLIVKYCEILKYTNPSPYYLFLIIVQLHCMSCILSLKNQALMRFPHVSCLSDESGLVILTIKILLKVVSIDNRSLIVSTSILFKRYRVFGGKTANLWILISCYESNDINFGVYFHAQHKFCREATIMKLC